MFVLRQHSIEFEENATAHVTLDREVAEKQNTIVTHAILNPVGM